VLEPSLSFYSYRRVSTGLREEARRVIAAVVIRVLKSIITPPSSTIHQEKEVRVAKFLSLNPVQAGVLV